MIQNILLSLPLSWLAMVGPVIADIDNTRFKVGVVFDDTSPMGHAKAQIALAKAAEKHCANKGRAVSDGTLELNNAQSIRKGKKALELIEVYTCVPKV